MEFKFLDQSGGAIMKENFNMLFNNYEKNYKIKPNLLKKTYISEIKKQILI